MSRYIIFRYVALTASVCLLAFAFQNCGESKTLPHYIPSLKKPIVPQLCEDAEDNSSCLIRAQCLHNNDRNCNKASDFVGEDNVLNLDKVAPVLIYSGETASLWAGFKKTDVNDDTYQWHSNTNFYNYSQGTELSGKIKKYFELPECNDSTGDAAKLDNSSVSYYYAEASYGEDKTLTAPFLVACSAGQVSDFEAEEGVRRRKCDKNVCRVTEDYKEAGDLILAAAGQGVRLKVRVDDDEDDLAYKWYRLFDLDTEVTDETSSCASAAADAAACYVANVNDEAVTGNELPVPFTQDQDNSNDGCELNKISYYKVVVTKDEDEDEDYKKTALFRVACVEAPEIQQASEDDENEGEDEDEDEGGSGESEGSDDGNAEGGNAGSEEDAYCDRSEECCELDEGEWHPHTCSGGQVQWPKKGINCQCYDRLYLSRGNIPENMPNVPSRGVEAAWRVGATIPNTRFPEATGGCRDKTYELKGSLPRGLSFNPNTRVLSGTLQVAVGISEVIYEATDECGTKASFRVEIWTRR